MFALLGVILVSCSKDNATTPKDPTSSIDHEQAQFVYDFVNGKTFTEYIGNGDIKAGEFSFDGAKFSLSQSSGERYEFVADKIWCHEIEIEPEKDGYHAQWSNDEFDAQVQLATNIKFVSVKLYKGGEQVITLAVYY